MFMELMHTQRQCCYVGITKAILYIQASATNDLLILLEY